MYDFQESRPVLEEKAGFYKVYAGYDEGWIKSSDCDVTDFEPIKESMLDSYSYKLFTTGLCSGYCVVWNCDELNGIISFEIGKKIGNFIVLKYSASYFEVVENTRVSFKNTSFDNFSLETLTDSDFVQILEVANAYEGTIGVIYAIDDSVELLYNIPVAN